MRHIFFCLLLFPLFLTAASPAITRLQGLLAPVRTMTAHFNQVVRDSDGEVLQRSEGTMVWSRPNRFYWHVQSPRQQLMVANGSVVWVYTPSLSQAQKRPMPAMANTPMGLLSGHLDGLAKHFTVTQDHSVPDREVFHLRPLGPDAHFQSVELAFKQNHLSAISMVDTMDQITVITLHGTQRNPRLSPQQFVFKPPQGTEIIAF